MASLLKYQTLHKYQLTVSEFKTIYTISGQTLVDIAIQEYGQYEGVFTLANDNDEITCVDQVFVPRTKLRVRIGEGNITSKEFELNNKSINSGFTPPEAESMDYIDDDYFDEDYI